jgi:hypothetical protein
MHRRQYVGGKLCSYLCFVKKVIVKFKTRVRITVRVRV